MDVKTELAKFQNEVLGFMPPQFWDGLWLGWDYKAGTFLLCAHKADWFNQMDDPSKELELLSRYYDGKWNDRPMFIHNVQRWVDSQPEPKSKLSEYIPKLMDLFGIAPELLPDGKTSEALSQESKDARD
jgi:hypothetical protein